MTLGSLLVTIQSKEENDFVRSLIPHSPSNDNDIWIALNDVAVEGSWVWEDGVALGAYNSWNSDEPNGGNNENCVEMYDESGKWNDMPCGDGRYYVCKT